MEVPKERITWIDNIKGFVLLMIVLQHYGIKGTFCTFTHPFEMPVFFFVSGCLFSGNKGWSNFVRSKVRTLFIPYIFLSVLFAFVDIRLYNVSFLESVDVIHLDIIDELKGSTLNSSSDYMFLQFLWILMGRSTPITGPLWFVFTLFMVNIVFYFANRALSGNKYLIMCYSLFSLLLGWACNILHIHLLFNIENLFTASFFYSMGYVMKNSIYSMDMKPKNICILVLLLPIYVYSVNRNGAYSLFSNSLGSDLFFFVICSMSGILLIIIIAKFFVKYQYMNMLLSWIAKNGMIILAVHYIINFYSILLLRNKMDSMLCYYTVELCVTMGMVPLFIWFFDNYMCWAVGKKK